MNIEQRLQRLEIENRRLKRIGFVLVLVPAMAVLMGQAAPDKEKAVRANRFVLTDSEGNERGVFEVKKNGQPALNFFDTNGNKRIQLYVGDETATALHFIDANGLPRLELARAKGGPVLNFIGEDHALRASLSAGEETKLDLYNSDNSRHRPIVSIKEGRHVFYGVGGKSTLLELP